MATSKPNSCRARRAGGRFDLQEVTAQISDRTGHLPGVTIAIAGCIVNGWARWPTPTSVPAARRAWSIYMLARPRSGAASRTRTLVMLGGAHQGELPRAYPEVEEHGLCARVTPSKPRAPGHRPSGRTRNAHSRNVRSLKPRRRGPCRGRVPRQARRDGGRRVSTPASPEPR